MDLSFAIIAHNEARNLPRTLERIKDWDAEIVVVDCGSTDNTVAVAQKYTDRVLERPNNPQLNVNKMEAIKACKNGWIFYLDADEVMTPALKHEIAAAIQSTDFDGYFVPRKNIIFGQWLRWGDNYPDLGLRLFRRGKGAFACQHVHEQLAVDGPVGRLKEPFLHYTYETVGQWISKMNFYTDVESQIVTRQHKNPWVYMLLRPWLRFWRNYIRYQGFRDGSIGFVYALLNAKYEFITGAKALTASRHTPTKSKE